MFHRYITFIVRYRLVVIVAVLMASALFATRIGNLRVIVDPNDNLPQEHPYVVASNEIERIFGGANLVVIGVESVRGDMAVIIADFKFGPELRGYQAIKERVESIVEAERDATVRIYQSGISINLAWLEIYSERMAYLFFGALAVIMAVLYLSFRSLQGMLVPILTALMSVIWGLGVMGLLSIPMDTFNATTPILIMAVAAGHSVQILKRYYEEYGRLHDSKQAVIESFTKIGPVMLTAGGIAVTSFLALTAFPTLTIRVFGIFTAIGIFSAMLLEMSFIPAFRSLLPSPKRYETDRERSIDWLARPLDSVARLILKRRWTMIFGGLALCVVVLAVGIDRVTVDNSLKGNFSAGSPVRLDDVPLNAGMGGTNTLYLLIEGSEPDSIKNPAVLHAMERVQTHLQTQYQLVGKTQSLADFLKRMNRAMHGDDPTFDLLPESRELTAQYLLLYSMSGDPGDFDTYVDYDYRSAVIWAYLKTDSTAYIERLIAELRPVIAQQFPAGYTVSIGGGMAQGAALNDVMVKGKLLNIGVIATSIYVIASLVLRSALAGIFVLIPLILAVMANFGIMGWSGIRLDIGTAAVSAMAVGVGADYAIYVIYRLREEVQRRGQAEQALRTTLGTAGKAVVYVALAVGAGYSVLMLTGFGMHARLGFLVALAMAVSCAAAIIVLPALLYVWRPSFVFNTTPSSHTESTPSRQPSPQPDV